MRNFAIGSAFEVDGRQCIRTTPGMGGHAVFGPYQHLEPGRYAVEFRIAATEDQSFARDFVCAVVDVTVGGGQRVVVSRKVSLSTLRDGPATVMLMFELTQPERAEYRVGVNGKAPLIVDEHRLLTRIPDGASDLAPLLDAARFPEPDPATAPEFFTRNRDYLRQLHADGAGVHIVDGTVVVRMQDVSFLAREPDDFNFIGEIFGDNTYNLLTANDVCMIDVGLNIGLVSLLFATRDAVREIHGFEPFPETHARARANIAINPDLAPKISTYEIALSDHDADTMLNVPSTSPSGSMTLASASGDVPVAIRVRDAARTLGPIMAAAQAAGRDVVMKVDCEGSEFAIFESMEAAGLLSQVRAFMVEWHAMYDGKTQMTLIAPLLKAGFVVFDQSRPIGNGFFYAVRGDRGPAA